MTVQYNILILTIYVNSIFISALSEY